MKNYTEEELANFIKSNNLDIKQLAAIAAKMAKEPEETEEEKLKTLEVVKPKASSQRKLGFELTICSYPDFAITRTTEKTTKTLSFMVSQQSYCIITNLYDGKKTNIAKLTADNYADFTSGMPDIEMPEDFWVNKIIRGKAYYDRLMHYVDLNHTVDKHKYTMYDMIKDHCAPKLCAKADGFYDDSNINSQLIAYANSPILYKEYFTNPKLLWLMSEHQIAVADFICRFGLNNMRDFFDALQLSLVDIETLEYVSYYWNPNGFLLEGVDYQYAAFKEYVLYKSVRFGYGKNLKDFFQTWKDDLNMQQKIYGKIKDKYPDSLPTHHKQICYKYELHKEKIDAANFAIHSMDAKKYAWKMDRDEGRFIFIAPKTPEDFYDEATQQANCLASYVSKFADGEDIIMFMRDKSTPEMSEVTIEIVQGHITQAYQAHNEGVNAEQKEAIKKWAKKFDLVYY